MRALLVVLIVGTIFQISGCKSKDSSKDRSKQKDVAMTELEKGISQHHPRWDADKSSADMIRPEDAKNRYKTEIVELKSYYDSRKNQIIRRPIRIPDSDDRPDCNMAEYATLLPDVSEPNYIAVSTSKGTIKLQYQFCMQTYKKQDSNDPDSYEWTFLGPVEPVVMPYGNEMMATIERKGCYRMQIKVPLNGKDVRENIEIQQDPNTVLIFNVYKKTGDYAYLISNPIFINEYKNWMGSWVYEDQVYTVIFCPEESFQIEFETTEWDNFFNPVHP